MNSNIQFDYDAYLISDFFLTLSLDEKLILLDYHDYKNIIRTNIRVSEKQIHAIAKTAIEKRGLTWARTILAYENQKKNFGKKITSEQLKYTNGHYLWRNYSNDYIRSLQEKRDNLRKHFKHTYNAFNKEYEAKFPSKRTYFQNKNIDILNIY